MAPPLRANSRGKGTVMDWTRAIQERADKIAAELRKKFTLKD
jgi:hypothetical protein